MTFTTCSSARSPCTPRPSNHAEAVKLLLADARAAQLVGGSYEHEARGIADDFEPRSPASAGR